MWVARRTVESPIFLKSGGFSQQGLFYLIKVPNLFLWSTFKPKVLSNDYLTRALWWALCLLFQLQLLTPCLPMSHPSHICTSTTCTVFLCSISDPCFEWVYITVSLHPSSIPAPWFPKKEFNYCLNYQTCLKFSAIHINIDMFFWIAYVKMHFGCTCDLTAFCNEILKAF